MADTQGERERGKQDDGQKEEETEGKKSNYFCSCEEGREGEDDEVSEGKERKRKR